MTAEQLALRDRLIKAAVGSDVRVSDTLVVRAVLCTDAIVGSLACQHCALQGATCRAINACERSVCGPARTDRTEVYYVAVPDSDSASEALRQLSASAEPGTVLLVAGKHYLVVADTLPVRDSCKQCAFDSSPLCVSLCCQTYDRPDRRPVHFVPHVVSCDNELAALRKWLEE